MPSDTLRGRDLVQQVFGGAFYQQGRGFYSALELFAILRGELLVENIVGIEADFVLPDEGKATYLRPSHDYARRLLVSEDVVGDRVFGTAATAAAVKGLLRGLEAPVPGRLRPPDKWQLRHLFPYPPEAIHYDAVERRGKVSVERYQFRGAGGFAHKVLRCDGNKARLATTRAGLRNLLCDGHSAVGQLLKALAAHDEAKIASSAAELEIEETSAFTDDVEFRSLAPPDNEGLDGETRWTELLREGANRIIVRTGLTDFDRVESLLHWIPFCIAMHQLTMARRVLRVDESAPLVFDAGYRRGAVRTAARTHFAQATNAVRESLLLAAKARAPEILSGGAAWWKGPRSFFTTTLFAVGAANANAGQRHFELRPQLVQAVIRALVDVPISHDVFFRDVLAGGLRIVCDTTGAEMLSSVVLDRRDLKSNGDALVARIDEVGMLRALSDATLMVGVYE